MNTKRKARQIAQILGASLLLVVTGCSTLTQKEERAIARCSKVGSPLFMNHGPDKTGLNPSAGVNEGGAALYWSCMKEEGLSLGTLAYVNKKGAQTPPQSIYAECYKAQEGLSHFDKELAQFKPAWNACLRDAEEAYAIASENKVEKSKPELDYNRKLLALEARSIATCDIELKGFSKSNFELFNATYSSCLKIEAERK